MSRSRKLSWEQFNAVNEDRRTAFEDLCFVKFDVASQKQLSVVFDAAKPPKATSR